MDGDCFFIQMKVQNQFIYMQKKVIWNANFWLLVEEIELKEAFSFSLTPSAKKEIKKVIYQHFDLIIESWNTYFNK